MHHGGRKRCHDGFGIASEGNPVRCLGSLGTEPLARRTRICFGPADVWQHEPPFSAGSHGLRARQLHARPQLLHVSFRRSQKQPDFVSKNEGATPPKANLQRRKAIHADSERRKAPIVRASLRKGAYFKFQKEGSGFTSSKPASQASWLRHTTSASTLRPVSGWISRTRRCNGRSAPTTAIQPE